ncbi:MAG: carbohydrate ABC transporter permease [Spirochaetales bacterium]|nr:carbohydrate ABC transporter permease [Spirochaetales bacterium]
MGRKIAIYVFAVLLFLFSAGPVLLTLVGGIIPEKVLLSVPPRLFSMKPTLSYYKYIFTGKVPEAYEERGALRAMVSEEARLIPRAMLNSATVALAVMAMNMVFGSMAAYAFARIRFRGKSLTFMGIIMCRLVPASALVVPFYMIIQALGLLDTKLALILVHTLLTLPFTVLILTMFFRRVPVEIEESAVVDGAKPLQVFWKITLPLSASSMVATGLFSFMLSYSEFMYSLVLGGSQRSRTLPVVMTSLIYNPDMIWGMLMSGVFLALIPSLILAILVWKFVVENIILGAMKY